MADGPIVAVLGGGQLGRMLGLAGVPMGLRFRFLDPAPDACAAAIGQLVVGALGDDAAVAEVSTGATAVTYEWEGVPADVVQRLADSGARVAPSITALAASQDRLIEKTTFEALDIDVAAFMPVDDADGLRRAIAQIGLPAVLKTRRGGYDGKGQLVLQPGASPDEAWTALGASRPLVLEALVPFDRELSVLAVRGADHAVRCWPVVENLHEEGILRQSIAPAANLSAALQERAERYARALLEHFDYVGVLAVELFEVGGELLANEFAPRVHNSGHWTIEGASTSQFENHLRAVLGWPLGATDARGVSAMVNCIGELPDPDAVLAVEGAHLHRYDKAPRPGRKVGHVTINAPDRAALDARLAVLLSRTSGSPTAR